MAVLAYSDGQTLSSSSCSSSALDAATLDLLIAKYGPGEEAAPLESPGLFGDAGFPVVVVAGALAFAGALAVGIFVVTRGQATEQ